MNKTSLQALIAAQIYDNTAHGISVASVREMLLETVNFTAGRNFNIRDYGAVGDIKGAHDCVIASPNFNTLSSVSVVFTDADIGKSLWFSSNTATRTITAVAAGVATFTPAHSGAVTSGEAYFYFGTDDTAAIQAALDAASAVAGPNLTENAGATNGMILMGGDVYAPAGSYGLFNSSASYSGGKKSALQIPRRVKFFGAGQHATSFCLLAGSYGHMIANKDITGGASSFADFIEISDMTLHGYQDFNPNALDGIHLSVAANGYEKTDPFNRVHDITCSRMKQDGFRFSGRGEFIGVNLLASECARYGFNVYGLADYKMLNCNAGGSKKTGIRIFASGAGHWMNCKSFYSGANGGSTVADCCNWYINADQMRNGLVYFTSCEGQESRGSSWVLDNVGMCILNGCIAADPARAGINSGTLPTVCAGFHLMGEGCRMNVFNGCLVTPSVAIFSLTDNWGLATDAVYIAGVDANGAGPQKNRGDIYTFEPSIGSGGAVDNGIIYRATYGTAGGAGTTNGRNTGLSINGTSLSKVVPLAPVISSATAKNLSVDLVWTAPFDGGSPLTDYVVQYKLSTEPTTWTTFSDGAGVGLSTTVTGLTNGSAYNFRLAAINAIGTGANSSTSTATPTAQVPSQVTGLYATGTGTTATLTWTAPFDGGSALTDYKYEYKLKSEPTVWTNFAHTASTATTASITGLTNAEVYDFRVSAINAVGTGTASSTASSMIFNPSDVSGLQLWIDPSDTTTITHISNVVSAINDKSVLVRHAVQATESKKPITNTRTINGLNALDFDGTDDALFTPVFTHTQPTTRICVVDLDGYNGSGQTALMDGGDQLMRETGGAFKIFAGIEIGSTARNTNANIHMAVYNSTASVYHINGTLNVSGNAFTGGTSGTLALMQRNAGGGNADGLLGDVIEYNKVLSTAEKNNLNTYLSVKYAITVATI